MKVKDLIKEYFRTRKSVSETPYYWEDGSADSIRGGNVYPTTVWYEHDGNEVCFVNLPTPGPLYLSLTDPDFFRKMEAILDGQVDTFEKYKKWNIRKNPKNYQS